jgi:hypothetical protein
MGVSLRLPRVVAALLLVLSGIAAPALAFADESNAEQLFQEGLNAMKRNDFAVACDAFGKSNRADPSPGTQINLAVCFEKRKMWASAWTWYRSALGLAQQRGQKEREQLADDAANRLKPSIHYLVIAVKDPSSDLVVKRDGAEVTTSLGGKEVPLPIDPGDHSIEVFARGKKPWTKVIHAADDSQTERIDVPVLENAAVEEKATGGVHPGPDRPAAPATNDGSTQRTVGIVVGAAGLLSALAGVGVFILAKNEESDRNKQRAAASTAGPIDKIALNKSADSHSSAADNDQLIALVLGGGALVLVGAGVVLYMTAPKAAEKIATSHVTPLVGPGFAGLGLGGSF